MFNTAMKDAMFKAAVAQRYGSYTGKLIITHNDRERIRKERALSAKDLPKHPAQKRHNPRVPG